MAAAILGQHALMNQAAPDVADNDVPWPPRGYFRCRLCDVWILVYPNNGEKVSRWYAEMHVKGRHFEQKVYRCKNRFCENHETYTRKAMIEHQKRRMKHRGEWKPGFERVVPEQEEKRLAAPLVAQCFPHVRPPMPPPK